MNTEFKPSEVAWPKGGNLTFFMKELPQILQFSPEQEKKFHELIFSKTRLPRWKRLVVLPNHQLLRKIICYHYRRCVEEGLMEETEAILILAKQGVNKKQFKRLAAQRAKELARDIGKFKK